MLSHDLLLHFQSDVTLLQSWWMNGKHYGRTSEAWLKLQDKNAKAALKELEEDAKAKGMDKIEGRKAFYRYIYYSQHFSLHILNRHQIQSVLSGCCRVFRAEQWRRVSESIHTVGPL